MPKRIQLKRKLGWRLGPNARSVSRPTKWGNPFNWQSYLPDAHDYSETEENVAKDMAVVDYENWLNGHYVIPIYEDQRKWILAHVKELAGLDLACWCKPGQPCHADILLELANE